MTAPKFTPGPWRAGELLPRGTTPVYQEVSGVRMEVSQVNGRDGEMESNAHLISAAPELYAALELCAETLQVAYSADEMAEGATERVQRAARAYRAARAAIGKAVGK